MANLEQIYDFETQLETAFRELVLADTGILARMTREKGLTPEDCLALNIAIGGSTDSHHHVASDGLEIDDVYSASLEIGIRTKREDGTATAPGESLHQQLKVKLRGWMVRGWIAVNDRLTLHEIERPPIPGSTDLEFADNAVDYTVLNYSLIFSIRSDAWASDV